MLLKSAFQPTAVFWLPFVLFLSALLPTAVLKVPVVLLRSALKPTADDVARRKRKPDEGERNEKEGPQRRAVIEFFGSCRFHMGR